MALSLSSLLVTLPKRCRLYTFDHNPLGVILNTPAVITALLVCQALRLNVHYCPPYIMTS